MTCLFTNYFFFIIDNSLRNFRFKKNLARQTGLPGLISNPGYGPRLLTLSKAGVANMQVSTIYQLAGCSHARCAQALSRTCIL